MRGGARARHVVCASLCSAVGFVGVGVATLADLPHLSFAAMFLASPSCTCLVPITLAWLTNSVHGSTTAATATGLVVGERAGPAARRRGPPA